MAKRAITVLIDSEVVDKMTECINNMFFEETPSYFVESAIMCRVESIRRENDFYAALEAQAK